MQSLGIISLNLWQFIISLLNLVVLFLILKYFLFKPVKKMLASRKMLLDSQYASAAEAESSALQSKNEYEQKLKNADEEAASIIKTAETKAERHGQKIVSDAKEKADFIVKQAKDEAESEKKKAAEDIRREITDVSSLIAEKMLEREIKTEDHRDLIDSFIQNIGEDND